MLTKERKTLTAELRNLPTVKYPDEVLERLRIKSDILKHQVAIGDVIPKTAEELIAEWGINLG